MALLNTIANTAMGSALTGVSISSTASLTQATTGKPALVIVASGITTGATFQVEVSSAGGGKWIPTSRFALTANGSYAVDIRPRQNPATDGASAVRLNCTSFTDGSYTPSLTVLTVK